MNTEGEGAPKPKRLFLKLITWLLLFVISLFATMAIFSYISDDVDIWLTNKKDQYQMWKWKRAEARHDSLLKKDFDGGKTPEETLDLYLTALRAGDVTKASKYYLIDDQAEALKDLKNEKAKQGNLNLSITYTEDVKNKGKKYCGDFGCTFEYRYLNPVETVSIIKGTEDKLIVPKGGDVVEGIDLRQNDFTKIWKIIYH
jgi:hypothetical protein